MSSCAGYFLFIFMSIKPRNLIIIIRTQSMQFIVQLIIIIIEFGMKSRIKFRIDDAITKWTNKQSIQRFPSCISCSFALLFLNQNFPFLPNIWLKPKTKLRRSSWNMELFSRNEALHSIIIYSFCQILKQLQTNART